MAPMPPPAAAQMPQARQSDWRNQPQVPFPHAIDEQMRSLHISPPGNNDGHERARNWSARMRPAVDIPTTYEGYVLRKDDNPPFGDPSWACVMKTPLILSQKSLLAVVKSLQDESKVLKQLDNLKSTKQRMQVERLIEEKRNSEKQVSAQWVLAAVEDIRGRGDKPGHEETKELRVVLRRQRKVARSRTRAEISKANLRSKSTRNSMAGQRVELNDQRNMSYRAERKGDKEVSDSWTQHGRSSNSPASPPWRGHGGAAMQVPPPPLPPPISSVPQARQYMPPSMVDHDALGQLPSIVQQTQRSGPQVRTFDSASHHTTPRWGDNQHSDFTTFPPMIGKPEHIAPFREGRASPLQRQSTNQIDSFTHIHVPDRNSPHNMPASTADPTHNRNAGFSLPSGSEFSREAGRFQPRTKTSMPPVIIDTKKRNSQVYNDSSDENSTGGSSQFSRDFSPLSTPTSHGSLPSGWGVRMTTGSREQVYREHSKPRRIHSPQSHNGRRLGQYANRVLEAMSPYRKSDRHEPAYIPALSSRARRYGRIEDDRDIFPRERRPSERERLDQQYMDRLAEIRVNEQHDYERAEIEDERRRRESSSSDSGGYRYLARDGLLGRRFESRY